MKDITFQIESDYLNFVVAKLKNEVRRLEGSLKILGEETVSKLSDLRQNPEKGMDFFLFLEQLQQKYTSLNVVDKVQRLEELSYLVKDPYFARIDLKKDDNVEKYYLGKFGYTENSPIIIDWRTKIASIYYRYRYPQKNVQYITAGGVFSADLTLKRTFETENGILLRYYNNDIQLDENQIMIEKIGERTGGVLEDIVETIQQSQLDIIEADPRQICIVQGCVGSGKSTVAIHKLAHIFFNFPKLIRPERSILVTKNQILSGYLSTLFPKLGIFDINYGTVKDMIVRLRYKERIQISFDLNAGDDLSNIDTNFIKMLNDEIKEIHDTYEKKLQEFFKQKEFEIYAGYIYDRKITVVENIKEAINEMEEELDVQIESSNDITISAFHRELHKMNISVIKRIIKLLKELLSEVKEKALPELAKTVSIDTKQKLSYSDSLVYVYLHSKIIGFAQFNQYEYCVVDEGQDFNVLEYAVLDRIVLHGRFCVLGDLNQGYKKEGILSWEDIVSVISNAKNANTFELTTNYRSTKCIIDFSKKVLTPYTSRYLPDSINRIGPTPEIKTFARNNDMLDGLISKVVKEIKNINKSMGIICFQDTFLDDLYKKLQIVVPSEKLIRLSGEKRISYIPTGVYLTGVENCKGLEFSKVFVIGLDLEKVSSFEEAKRAFVAITRAMNELHVYGVCEKTS